MLVCELCGTREKGTRPGVPRGGRNGTWRVVAYTVGDVYVNPDRTNRGLNYVRVVGEHRALVRRVQRLARGRKASGRVTMKSHTGTDVIIPTP